jgi:hypothetical protein
MKLYPSVRIYMHQMLVVKGSINKQGILTNGCHLYEGTLTQKELRNVLKSC